MFYTFLTYLRVVCGGAQDDATNAPVFGSCCKKKTVHPIPIAIPVVSNKNYDTIKSNIRNFEPLSSFDKEFIYHSTSLEQKCELIDLYDTCMRILINNVLYVLRPDNENSSECVVFNDVEGTPTPAPSPR